MSQKLVAFFSASGHTAALARQLAEASGADLCEIRPETPYTAADLNWQNKQSRSSVEMSTPGSRPAIAAFAADLTAYDTVYLGFPIWWYSAPTIINTFLESGDFSGKTIILFAASGGSGFGKTVQKLQPSAPDARFIEGKVNPSASDLQAMASM